MAEAKVTAFTKCSEILLANPVPNALAHDTQTIFVGTADGGVQALDKDISDAVWRTQLGGDIVSNIVATEAGTVVASNPVSAEEKIAESILRSLSKETGLTIWTVRLPFSDQIFLDGTGKSIIAVAREGWAVAVEIRTGRILWQTSPLGTISARPNFSMYGIAFGTTDKQIFILSPETGSVLFQRAADFIPTAISNPTPETLVVGDERGKVALLSLPTGKSIWKFKSGAAVSFVHLSKDGLLVTSLDNFIYLLSAYNGDVIWKRRLSGRVVEGAVVMQGHIITLIYGENSAYLIDLKKGKIVDQIEEHTGNFVNQVPVVIDGSRILITTPKSVEIFAIAGCNMATEKAASRMPPSKN